MIAENGLMRAENDSNLAPWYYAVYISSKISFLYVTQKVYFFEPSPSQTSATKVSNPWRDILNEQLATC